MTQTVVDKPEQQTRRPAGSWLSRRPAMLAAVCFIGGIVLHDQAMCAPLIWAGFTLALAIVATIFLAHEILSSLTLAFAIVSAGMGVGQLEAFYYPRADISAYATSTPRLAWLELFIEHEPRILSDPFSRHPLPPKQVATAKVLKVKCWDGWRDTSGEMLVQIRQPHPRLAASQTIRVIGTLEHPSPATNPGQFDFAKYYREQRILTSLHIDRAGNIEILEEARATWMSKVRQLSRHLLGLGFAERDSTNHALLRALVLGDNDPELRDIQEQFRRTGTSHHLAISGLHIAVLGAFVYYACRALRMRPRFAVLLTTAMVALYGVAALPSPPVMRSVLMGIFIGLGLSIARGRDPVQLLSLSVLAMLIYSPLDLYSAGFQLSFGTVLGLILFTPHVDRFLRSFRAEDWPLTRQKTRSTMSMLNDIIVRAFAAGLVAWGISMPLIAYHFGQINPYAIMAGIILAPFVFVALIGGFVKIIFTLAFPAGAEGWAFVASLPMTWMRGVLAWLDKIPGSDFPLPAPPVWLIVLFYAFCLLLLVPYRRPKWHVLIRATPVTLCFTTMLLPLFRVRTTIVPDESLKFTLLSVGAGQCAVVEAPGGKTVIIDAGSTSLSDALRKCLAPFLRREGVVSVDQIYLTHSDYDHISAAAEVASVYDVRETLAGPRFRSIANENPAADMLLKQLETLDLPPRIVSPGERIPLSRESEIEVLWSPRDSALSSNDSSVVLKVHYAGRSILLSGDIQADAQNELLESPERLKSDVLIAPHHGSREDSTERFINAIDPEFILSSNDRTLTGKQKRFSSLVRNRKLFRTNTHGAITVIIHRDGKIEVTPFLRNPYIGSP
jgi:competence protein ComEC